MGTIWKLRELDLPDAVVMLTLCPAVMSRRA